MSNLSFTPLALDELEDTLCTLVGEMRRTTTSGVGLKVYADTAEDAVKAIREMRAALAQQAQCPAVGEGRCDVSELRCDTCPERAQQAQPLTDAQIAEDVAAYKAGNMGRGTLECLGYVRGMEKARDRMAQQAEPNLDTRDCIVCHDRIAPNYGICFKCHTAQPAVTRAAKP